MEKKAHLLIVSAATVQANDQAGASNLVLQQLNVEWKILQIKDTRKND
jgi:hypothetical protein